MNRMTYWAIVAVFAASAPVAHEQSLHKGHPTEGRVASASDKVIVLKTDAGDVSVTLEDMTKIERDESRWREAEIWSREDRTEARLSLDGPGS